MGQVFGERENKLTYGFGRCFYTSSVVYKSVYIKPQGHLQLIIGFFFPNCRNYFIMCIHFSMYVSRIASSVY